MRFTALVLIIMLGALTAAPAFAQEAALEAAEWRHVAKAIPLGTTVKVQRVDGKRFNGTLMRVDESAITLKKNTRVPEPAVTIAFDQVAKVERVKPGGFSIGKAIAIGAGAGAGAMLTIILFLMQID
jgi:hypothetical protein